MLRREICNTELRKHPLVYSSFKVDHHRLWSHQSAASLSSSFITPLLSTCRGIKSEKRWVSTSIYPDHPLLPPYFDWPCLNYFVLLVFTLHPSTTFPASLSVLSFHLSLTPSIVPRYGLAKIRFPKFLDHLIKGAPVLSFSYVHFNLAPNSKVEAS